MAIDPSATYPGQVDSSDPAGWPHSRARNESSPGARDGFPLEETWVQDLQGWQQALLDAAGLTPSNAPDRVGASQYLQAIQALDTATRVGAVADAKRLLALQQSVALAHREPVGILDAAPTPVSVLYDDVTRQLLVAYLEGHPKAVRSGDEGSTFEIVYDGPIAPSQCGRGAISPGNYALISWVDSGPDQVAVAAAPYGTWTEVDGPFGAPGTATGLIAHLVSAVDGAAALMMLTPGGLLVTASATAPPAVLGDFTEIDLSSIMSDARGLATNGVRNVIAGSDPVGTDATVFHSLVSAGGVAGDWTPVLLHAGAGHVQDVVWTGSVFVALVESGRIYTSVDGMSWSLRGAMDFTGAGDFRMLADTDSGMVVAHRDSATQLYVGRGDVRALVPLDVHAGASVIRAGDTEYGRLAWDPIDKRLFGFSGTNGTGDVRLTRTI